MNKNSILLGLTLCLTVVSYAQETNKEDVKEESKPHKIAFTLGLTHIPEAFEEGKTEKAVFVPTIGLDYFYQLNEKWNLGIALDLELGNYVVDFNQEDLSRDNAFIAVALAGYEILPRWEILMGPGIEFEKNENLLIFRLCTEYEFELGNDWGLFPSFSYDFKERYSTWALSLGISKRL